jgi:hypothetical protein
MIENCCISGRWVENKKNNLNFIIVEKMEVTRGPNDGTQSGTAGAAWIHPY